MTFGGTFGGLEAGAAVGARMLEASSVRAVGGGEGVGAWSRGVRITSLLAGSLVIVGGGARSEAVCGLTAVASTRGLRWRGVPSALRGALPGAGPIAGGPSSAVTASASPRAVGAMAGAVRWSAKHVAWAAEGSRAGEEDNKEATCDACVWAAAAMADCTMLWAARLPARDRSLTPSRSINVRDVSLVGRSFSARVARAAPRACSDTTPSDADVLAAGEEGVEGAVAKLAMGGSLRDGSLDEWRPEKI